MVHAVQAPQQGRVQQPVPGIGEVVEGQHFSGEAQRAGQVREHQPPRSRSLRQAYHGGQQREAYGGQ